MQRSLQTAILGELDVQLACFLPGLSEENYGTGSVSRSRKSKQSRRSDTNATSISQWEVVMDKVYVPSVKQFVASCACAARAM